LDESAPTPNDSEARSTADTDEWWVDRYVLYSMREPMLWALLFVVLAHFAAFIASAVLTAGRTGHPVAISLSLLLLGGTAWSVRAEVRRKGKLAGLTWLLAATWILSGVTAYVGDRLDLL
jgi:heme/copper-type cytochrome/quinol oxidase subunit 3